MFSVVVLFLLCCFVFESLEGTESAVRFPQRIRYASRVCYDGSKFHGWQDQKVIRTVQGTLSRTLSRRFDQELRVTGASRTDQGVHAQGQVMHFDLPPDLQLSDIELFEHSFNRMLPTDLRIYNLTIAPRGDHDQIAAGELFHATKSAIGKQYIYRFSTRPFVDPLRRNYCSHVRFPLDVPLFQA